MRKNKKQDYKGFKSKEELNFFYWLEEASQKGYVSSFDYECNSFLLSDKVTSPLIKVLTVKTQEEKQAIMAKHIYTPDFKIIWTKKAEDLFFTYNLEKKQKEYPFMMVKDNTSWVEIKPVFDQNNMERLFKINQKWVYDKYGIYVNLIKPTKKRDKKSPNKQTFFEQTFTPIKLK